MPFLGMFMKKSFLWKQVLAILLAVVLFVVGAVDYFLMRNLILSEIQGKLQIHFLDVGQGDATLLILPTGERIMIDTGTPESGEQILAHFAKWKVDRLDYVILSHSHSDHAGGLPLLEETIGVGRVIYTGNAPENCSTPMQEVNAGDCFSVGAVNFSVLGPLSEEVEDEDEISNRSMILRLDYGETSVLFTGDAEAEEESLLLATCPTLLDVDLLKVAHHGSNSSSTKEFLNAVTPKIAIISASADNSYGHPSPNVVDRLTAVECNTYSTHIDGTILYLSNGATFSRYRSKLWL